MSGGHFDYDQYKIDGIAESIQSMIDRNGREKTKSERERWSLDDEYYEKYPDEKFYYKYPDDIIDRFKKGIIYLKIAEVYAQRIDWLLSGDDGEDNFRKRLKEDLLELKDWLIKKEYV
jgi:hypothetical protein